MNIFLVFDGNAVSHSSINGEEDQEFPKVNIREIFLLSDSIHDTLFGSLTEIDASVYNKFMDIF